MVRRGEEPPCALGDEKKREARHRRARYGCGAAEPRGIVNRASLKKSARCCQTLEGSFSAISKPIFAKKYNYHQKYAFCKMFQNAQYLQPFAPLQTQNSNSISVSKISDFGESPTNIHISQNILQNLQNALKLSNVR